jgi:hypothetical protein
MARPAIVITKREIMECLKNYTLKQRDRERLYKEIKNNFPLELIEFIDETVSCFSINNKQSKLKVDKYRKIQ